MFFVFVALPKGVAATLLWAHRIDGASFVEKDAVVLAADFELLECVAIPYFLAILFQEALRIDIEKIGDSVDIFFTEPHVAALAFAAVSLTACASSWVEGEIVSLFFD